MTTTIEALKAKPGKKEDVFRAEVCFASQPITYMQDKQEKRLMKLAVADRSGSIIVLIYDEKLMNILPGADTSRKVLKCGGLGGAYT